MSTGAWIFTGLIAAAVVAPTAVYAAASSTVAIGNTGSGTTAKVTGQRQLLTTIVEPNQVVRVRWGSNGTGCTAAYTPPAGKALVVLSVTYELGSGTAGTGAYGYLANANCTEFYDAVDTMQAYETQRSTFPAGLPVPSLGLEINSDAYFYIYVTGYLIPASQLPAAADHGSMPTHPLPLRH